MTLPIPRHVPPALLAALAVLLAAPAPALPLGQEPPGRGVVDGSFLERFAPEGENGTFVEVSLSRPLLELAAQAIEGQDRDLAEMVRQLRSVSAWVIDPEGADGKASRLDQVARRFRELAARLRKEGWQPLARVRDGGDEVHVLLLPGGKSIDGLTVMVRSADGEVVFANIAGQIDLERLGEVMRRLNVPGMDEALSALPGRKKPTPPEPPPPPRPKFLGRRNGDAR